MLALQIKDIKSFMSKLLNTDTFDSFLLQEAHIQSFNTFVIDGHLNRGFYSREELEDPDFPPYDLSSWETMRGICFQLIKGKKVPLLLKLTLVYDPHEAVNLLEKAGAAEFTSALKSFVLTIKYDQKGLLLTTGTSFNTFFMDRTPALIWDEALRQFLLQKEIDFDDYGN